MTDKKTLEALLARRCRELYEDNLRLKKTLDFAVVSIGELTTANSGQRLKIAVLREELVKLAQLYFVETRKVERLRLALAGM